MSSNQQPENLLHPDRRRRLTPWILGALVILLLSLLIALQAFRLWTVVPPDTASDTLLLYALTSLNFVAFIVFAFIFLRSLLKLGRERRQSLLGSKIKTRLVVSFIAVSLLPITGMAVFSYLFFNRSLEKWFRGLPEDVVRDALQLQNDAREDRRRSFQDSAAVIAAIIEKQAGTAIEPLLQGIAQRAQVSAILLISQTGETLVFNSTSLVEQERVQLKNQIDSSRDELASKSEISGLSGFDVAKTELNDGRQLILFRPAYTDSNIDERIAGSESEYQNLVRRQRRVRSLGLSTLGLLTLLLIFSSTWIAIHLARGITVPIQALAEASNEIARGNLSHRVDTIADDELALLADSFNRMTGQLQENRRRIEAGAAELREKNLALEERRNYIETVLESLSTGVVTVNSANQITTINSAARSILRVQDQLEGSSFSEILMPDDRPVLERILKRARRAGRATEQTELSKGAGNSNGLPVALAATALGETEAKDSRGVVLVIEDLSDLLAAQRASAWSEVARRMAHEIKNPLTPIQLSAERIARNVLNSNGDRIGRRSPVDREEWLRIEHVVEQCTATINREVAGLKAMVDEFSRFARLPMARLEPAELNEVVQHSLALYQDRLNGITLDVRLDKSIPKGMIDPEQFRRVMVNLIDNALEAISAVEGEQRITVATAHDRSRALLLLEVADTGHGIARGDFSRLFQPYFSTRGRGSGFGLAIVHRIVTEHTGRIRAESNHPRGARFIIELPAVHG